MRIAIVGSRDYQPIEDVARYVAALPVGTVIVSGGARGVDTAAIDAAHARGLVTHVVFADWKAHGRAAGPIRNRAMLETVDRVVAFWDGKSRGTRDAIAVANSLGLSVEVHS